MSPPRHDHTAEHRPDLASLIRCGAAAAKAMGQPAPDEAGARSFFETLLFKSLDEGGRDVWEALMAGIITEVEARHMTLARFATWCSWQNSAPEPSYETWGSPDIERRFDLAILGHPAAP